MPGARVKHKVVAFSESLWNLLLILNIYEAENNTSVLDLTGTDTTTSFIRCLIRDVSAEDSALNREPRQELGAAKQITTKSNNMRTSIETNIHLVNRNKQLVFVTQLSQ